METNELNLKKRIARNKIAKELLLKFSNFQYIESIEEQIKQSVISGNQTPLDLSVVVNKEIVSRAINLANAFVNEIENNII